MSIKSVKRSINYAVDLVNGGKHQVATEQSIENVQTAVHIIDRLPIKTTSVIREQHIVPLGEAIELMANEYWKDGSAKSLAQYGDLCAIRRANGSGICKYRFVYDPRLRHDRVACSIVDLHDFMKLVRAVKHANHLDAGEIKVSVGSPF